MGTLGQINIGDKLYSYTADQYVTVVSKLFYNRYLVTYIGESRRDNDCIIDDDGYAYYKMFKENDIKSKNQVIFWDKPQIIAPPKPKVKKEFVVRPDRIYGVFCMDHLQIEDGKWLLFENKRMAKDACERIKMETYVGEVKISYMIEE